MEAPPAREKPLKVVEASLLNWGDGDGGGGEAALARVVGRNLHGSGSGGSTERGLKKEARPVPLRPG